MIQDDDNGNNLKIREALNKYYYSGYNIEEQSETLINFLEPINDKIKLLLDQTYQNYKKFSPKNFD